MKSRHPTHSYFIQANQISLHLSTTNSSSSNMYFYLDKSVHPSAACGLFCSCTQSCRWCFCRSARSRRCGAHTRQYLGETNDIITDLPLKICSIEITKPPFWPLHVFPSGCSVKPTGQLQRTPVDVSLQVQSHPPLFTAQVSEMTAHGENASELSARGRQTLRYHSTSDTKSLVKQKLYCAIFVLSPERLNIQYREYKH